MNNRESIADEIHQESTLEENPKTLSAEVFSGYLKWTGISMFAASIISIVLFILVNKTYTTTQSLEGYSTLSKYFLKTTLLAVYETVEKCDNLTPGYWCDYPIETIEYFIFFPSGGKFSNPHEVNRLIANHTTQNKICYYFNTFEITLGNVRYTIREIKAFCIAMDTLIVFILFITLALNQYRAQERHSSQKRNMIDKFSVKITNLPPLPKYELMCKLKAYLEKEVETYLESNPIARYRFQIFDIVSNIQDEEEKQSNIKEGTENRRKETSQERLESKIQRNMFIKRVDRSHTEVWVTFATVSNRKLILSILQANAWYMKLICCGRNNPSKFQNHTISVRKAPNPEDIIYKNLKVTNTSRLIVRLIIYLVSLCLLIITTFFLLFLKRLSSVILSSIAVIITNLLAPKVLVHLSKYQRHDLATNENISNINKIAIYKFINTGLVVFLSQFKIEGLLSYFSNYFGYFTNQKYSSVNNSAWILNTGLSIVYTMLLQIVASNFKMFLNIGIYYLKLWKAQKTQKPRESIPDIRIEDIDGYQLYGQIAAVMMIILSYSYLLPILYPIGFLIFFSNYLSYSSVSKYVVFPSDSFNNLTKTASSLTLLAIILHVGVVGLIQSSSIHFYVASFLGVFYIFRVFFIQLIISWLHFLKRVNKIREENTRRQMYNVQQQQFPQLMSNKQKHRTRCLLKARRESLQRFMSNNPNIDGKYPLEFKEFLKFQRDVIKFTPEIESRRAEVVGPTSYYQ